MYTPNLKNEVLTLFYCSPAHFENHRQTFAEAEILCVGRGWEKKTRALRWRPKNAGKAHSALREGKVGLGPGEARGPDQKKIPLSCG